MDFVLATTPPVRVLFLCVGLASEPCSRPYIALELVRVGLDLTPSDDGLGNNDDNNPDDDDPVNGPSDDQPGDDDLDENDPEDKPDFPDPDTEPTIMVLDNLAEAIKLLAHNAHTSPESSSRTKLHEPDTFDGTDPKKLHAFFIQYQIKDEVCQVGKPWTLHELCHLAQEIDAHYWEHKEEIQWAGKHQGLSTSSNNKSGGSSNNNQPKTGQEKAKTSNNNNSGSSPKPGNNNSNLSKPKPSKLGKDGKLTPEECKHCMDGNPCMFCGGSGHFADKCPKKAGQAKAHAVATTKAAPAPGSGSTPETQK
ncbi:hypothetical protein M404DRAFT_25714 [Pisolithus tinctorius Marx 270]|uniref:CCHC-type domain-containing protein n=1 Tax=Pisolithus tinctorius Marx 270 TaxID=870435 RepID=A0A0C3PAY5_PISTI|nr:hypothetical protein M404DRAFT_25714 [Pisolithus tinctorius Marx 270]